MKNRVTLRACVALAAALVCAIGGAEDLNWTAVYDGIELATFAEENPLRKVVVARVDLQAPGVALKTTGPNPDFAPDERETVRETVPMFLERNDLTLAVNGNYYTPFGGRTITKPGDANLRGLAVCDGFVVSKPEPGFPSFVLKKDGSLEIRQYGVDEDLSEIQIAVSGPRAVLKDGEILEQTDVAVHPRTAIGFSKDQRYLYLMTIDGRRPEYSVGAKYSDVGADLLKAGAYDGLNLDGGGSTTMAARGEDGKTEILNWPINAISPDGLRFNGNAIGVTAEGELKTPLGEVVSIRNTGEAIEWTPAYDGIEIATWIEYDAPLQKIYAARIDLRQPGVEIKTSAPHENFELNKRETYRQTTAQFLETSKVNIAVNANFYSPFNATTIRTPGDANVSGLAVCDGFVESTPQDGYPSFVVYKNGDVDIRQFSADEDLSEIAQAVSGNRIVLREGEIVSDPDNSVHPRTAIGYSKDRQYLYFVVIDGRQEGYSVGAGYENVAKALQLCGAYDGLNLDGGGSTTMAILDEDGEALVLNRPANATNDLLRFNGNSIGVAAPGKLRTRLVDGRVKTPSQSTEGSVKFVVPDKL
ncbi:MAG: phosphodiester glycosidase family protein [Thermoguttaceae bacterium]|jgi:exopolysaccharide biosynthesis protein